MSDMDLFKKMFFSVFDPKKNERIVLLHDVPSRSVLDNVAWLERRRLLDDWYRYCLILGDDFNFDVEKVSFNATGGHNRKLNNDILLDLKKFNVIIAMTEFSATSSLVDFVRNNSDSIRCASMPLAEKRMMNTVFSMDYSDVKRYAHGIKDLLQKAIAARVIFSTGHRLDVDIRFRDAGADDGDCSRPGNFINLPSGEGFIAPYEAEKDEMFVYGESKTNGVLPFYFKDEFVRGIVEKNKIVDFVCNDEIKKDLDLFFDMFVNRRNIAELGIGCNPNARVTGNFIEDEKAGLHIAYGGSSHLGGKINSDIHNDIVYAKNCPIYAESLFLFDEGGDGIEIVKKGVVQYDLLR